MQQCTDCNTPLPARALYCPQCGKSNPNLQVSTPSPVNATPYSSPTSNYMDPTFYAANQRNAGPYNPTPRPGPTFQSSRRPLSRGALLLSFLLTLLLMASGVGLIYYATTWHPAQLRAEATATVKTLMNATAQASATARVQATATGHAVATAQAQSTAQVQSTATALQDAYARVTSGTPTIEESLSGQTASNWDEYVSQDGGGCAFAGGALHASVLQKGYYIPCFAQSSSFANFALEIQVKITNGDEGGVIFRGSDKDQKFYLFHLLKGGYYSLGMISHSDHETTLADDKSSAINPQPNQSNTLGIVARGSTILLYINKQYVGSASDSTFARGMIGVFAVDVNNTTDVAFSNLRVWTL